MKIHPLKEIQNRLEEMGFPENRRMIALSDMRHLDEFLQVVLGIENQEILWYITFGSDQVMVKYVYKDKYIAHCLVEKNGVEKGIAPGLGKAARAWLNAPKAEGSKND